VPTRGPEVLRRVRAKSGVFASYPPRPSADPSRLVTQRPATFLKVLGSECKIAALFHAQPGLLLSLDAKRPKCYLDAIQLWVERKRACSLTWPIEGWVDMSKVFHDASSALAGLLRDGMVIMSGGFGLCGIPESLIQAIRAAGVGGLTVISNNAGVDGIGLGLLLESRQIRKMVSSYVGENKLFAQQYLAGELELEFNPQGTLAERIRAGGAGIPAFYTKTGVGTLVAEGKDHREFDGETYIMERGLVADLSIVHAYKGDSEGNLVYRKTARNFNPMMASAGRVTVAEVETLVESGSIEPDTIVTPGIFVQRLVEVGYGAKHIEQRTTRKRPV
jgi:3-oxoacid CoA-transferase subunit A